MHFYFAFKLFLNQLYHNKLFNHKRTHKIHKKLKCQFEKIEKNYDYLETSSFVDFCILLWFK